MNDKEIFVSIQFGVETHLVGTLWCHQKNNRQSASFMYDHNWLKHPERFAIDPALQLTPGTFHTSESQLLFGAIGDSAPDRWGRVLMRRSENARAKANGETPRSLQEADYLLGVHDEARLGALRFSEHPNGPFLADDDKKSIPPLIRLPQLLGATERYLNESESYEDLRLLLLPGSSLGGARPKLPYETTMDLCCWRNFHEKMMVIKLSYGKRWRLHLQRKLVSIQSLGDWKKSWTHPYCLSTGLIAVMPIESPSCLR